MKARKRPCRTFTSYRAAGAPTACKMRVKKRRYVSPVDLAGIYTVLGDHEKAMTLLENALEQHNGRLLFIHQYHEFDPLRNSPRFTRILQAVGAPAAL